MTSSCSPAGGCCTVGPGATLTITLPAQALSEPLFFCNFPLQACQRVLQGHLRLHHCQLLTQLCQQGRNECIAELHEPLLSLASSLAVRLLFYRHGMWLELRTPAQSASHSPTNFPGERHISLAEPLRLQAVAAGGRDTEAQLSTSSHCARTRSTQYPS